MPYPRVYFTRPSWRLLYEANPSNVGVSTACIRYMVRRVLIIVIFVYPLTKVSYRNMKKLIMCLGVSSLLIGSASAQHSLPSPRWGIESLAHQRATAANYIGWAHLDAPAPFASPDQKPYLDTLARLLGEEQAGEEAVQRLLDHYPASLDYEQARLLLALVHYDRGRTDEALATLASIRDKGLKRTAREQYQVLYGYLLLSSHRQGSDIIAPAKALLEQAALGTSLWSDRACLYLSSLDWLRGDIASAQRRLEDRQWSLEMMPEVEYQGAMLSYASDSPSEAIAQTQALLRRYPELGRRPRLIGSMGRAYYTLGDYDNAIKSLASMGNTSDLLPLEAYALGASYYHREEYAQALAPLQQAAHAEGVASALAQFALGNVYRSQGEVSKAQLALNAAVDHPEVPAGIREQSLYQLIELSISGGIEAFGLQIRQIERFLADYPESVHRARVLDFIKASLSGSSDYAGSLSVIDRLERSGERLSGIRQDVLVRQASSLNPTSDQYQHTLSSAIALGDVSEAYGIARVMRAAYYLRQGQYRQAESDARIGTEYRFGIGGYEHGIASYILGYALYNQERYADALGAFSAFAHGGAPVAQRADALVRMGDAMLASSGKSAEALKYYNEANKLSPTGSDEALYRLSGIYGQRGEYSSQIAVVQELEREHPQSPYMARLLYDKGRAQLLGLKNSRAAEATFAEVEARYPASDAAPLAALERALLLSNDGKEEAAIRAYRHVIERYPDSQEAQTALSDLRSIYQERNELDQYAAYASSLGGKLRPSADDEAHLAYIAIESRARRGEQVHTQLEDYLSKYPKGADYAKAQILLASQYVKANQPDRAIALLQQASDATTSGHEELPLRMQLGELFSSTGRIADAVKAYERAYTLARGSKLQSQISGLAYARTAYQAQQYSSTTKVAGELLARQDLEPDTRAELLLLKGKGEEGDKAVKTAIATYAQLANHTNSPHGAEATVRRADLLLRLGSVADAQRVLEVFVESGSSQQYWLARAFVLMADCYERQGELYLAQQYIESLRDNYKGDEADIQEMIKARLTKYASNKV